MKLHDFSRLAPSTNWQFSRRCGVDSAVMSSRFVFPVKSQTHLRTKRQDSKLYNATANTSWVTRHLNEKCNDSKIKRRRRRATLEYSRCFLSPRATRTIQCSVRNQKRGGRRACPPRLVAWQPVNSFGCRRSAWSDVARLAAACGVISIMGVAAAWGRESASCATVARSSSDQCRRAMTSRRLETNKIGIQSQESKRCYILSQTRVQYENTLCRSFDTTS